MTELHRPCLRCNSLAGEIHETPGKQNGFEVVCTGCGTHSRWLSKAELGLAPTSLRRRNISVAVETRVFARDGGRCFLCRELPDPPDNPLEIGHVISRNEALTVLGWTELQADDESNLFAICKRHNIGMSDRSLNPGKVNAERARRSLNLFGGDA